MCVPDFHPCVPDFLARLPGRLPCLGNAALVGNFGGVDLFIDYSRGDGNDVALYTASAMLLTSVPEPGAVTMLALLVLGLCCKREQRRSM